MQGFPRGMMGILAARLKRWHACAPTLGVLCSIQWGYRLQFLACPPFWWNNHNLSFGEGFPSPEGENPHSPRQRDNPSCPTGEHGRGVLQPLLLLPKKGGGLRPILDLWQLNKHLNISNVAKAAKSMVPSCDLVLEAMCEPPFEPLESLDLRMLSYKTALLLAMASAKHVGDLHALSVCPTCIQFVLD